MIDLRSDTFTVPCENMRQAMFEAKVGDDVYGEDPTVNELEERIAAYFGKEAALFVPSGTMSNQISLKVLTQPGDEILTDADAHIYYYETAAPAVLSQIQIRSVKSTNGMPDVNELESLIRPDIYYFPTSSVICLENTHNRHGGTIVDLNYIKDTRHLVDKYNLKFHLDGARIWNAIAETGISGVDYAKHFDTLSVCLSKGMGAPIGSLFVSSKELVNKARKWRKIFGGGMRQAGIIASAGIYALENNIPKLKIDHENAKLFARLIAEIQSVTIDLSSVQTNMVRFELPSCINPKLFVSKCLESGLKVSSIEGQAIRAVFYLNITREMAIEASEIVKNVVISLS